MNGALIGEALTLQSAAIISLERDGTDVRTRNACEYENAVQTFFYCAKACKRVRNSLMHSGKGVIVPSDADQYETSIGGYWTVPRASHVTSRVMLRTRRTLNTEVPV